MSFQTRGERLQRAQAGSGDTHFWWAESPCNCQCSAPKWWCPVWCLTLWQRERRWGIVSCLLWFCLLYKSSFCEVDKLNIKEFFNAVDNISIFYCSLSSNHSDMKMCNGLFKILFIWVVSANLIVIINISRVWRLWFSKREDRDWDQDQPWGRSEQSALHASESLHHCH